MSALLALLALAACSGDAPAPEPATLPPAPVAAPASPAAPPEPTPVEAPPSEASADGPDTWTLEPVVQKAGAAHARVTGVRAATHEGFDRIVLEFEGDSVPGYRLALLSPPLTNCTSGAPVTVEGGGALQIQLAGTSGHDDAGASTTPLELRPALPSVREIERTCDFEGVVAFAVGVATPTPFRAFPLAAPARLVVDVKR